MPFPAITQLLTERTIVRPVSDEDLHDLFEINGDVEVTRYLPYPAWTAWSDGVAWLSRMRALSATETGQQLVIERREDRKVIGTVLLFRFDGGSSRLEIGYVLGRRYWRQGFASEAIRGTCDHLFRHAAIRRIEAEVNPLNLASDTLIHGLGFTREGFLRQRWINQGTPADIHFYGCLAEDWLAAATR